MREVTGQAGGIVDGDEIHEEIDVGVDDYGVEGASALGVGFGQLAIVVDRGTYAQAANQSEASSCGGFDAGREIFHFDHWVP